MTVATRVWTESARLAAEADPYAGLLVSLHVLNLSSIAQRNDGTPHERAHDRQDLFLLNRFQQQEIERQEELRRALGMRTDLPLRLGLAKPGSGTDEDRLRFNFGLLRAMDAFSLDACCAEPLFPKVPAVILGRGMRRSTSRWITRPRACWRSSRGRSMCRRSRRLLIRDACRR